MGNMRTVGGVISAFCSLILIFLVGGGVFYKILNATDTSTLPEAWQTLYGALDSVFSVSLSILIFTAFLCAIAPLTWIFLGIRDQEGRF